MVGSEWSMATKVRYVSDEGLEKRGEELDVGRLGKMQVKNNQQM